MTSNFDFWNLKKTKKSTNFKKNFLFFFDSFKKISIKMWLFTKSFFVRLSQLPKSLNKSDKIVLLCLFIILAGLSTYYFKVNYFDKTKIVPALGGTYKEILTGEAQYFNPILAKTDVDKTINRMIYSGLVKVDSSGQILPDLATSWEISPDGKSYTFYLAENIFWHDGVQFSSSDVVATITSIKDQNLKSPYFDLWKNVDVEVSDEKTIVFKLPTPYGPFIYSTTVGIIPAHVDFTTLSSEPVGTGPYKFQKAKSSKNQKITEVDLEKSEQYIGENFYIQKLTFEISSDEKQAKNYFDSRSVNAISNIGIEDNNNKIYSYSTSRFFSLIFNTKSDKFKDAAIRKKIKSGEKFDPSIEFSLLVLDKSLSVSAAEELVKEYQNKGIIINLNKQSAVNYQELLDKREYQAVFYGFDFGYDRDPYPFWHSSQISKGQNYSGFSDKSADILLEDARMTSDTIARNQKYDQFMTIFNDLVPAIFLSPQNFSITLKNNVFGVSEMKGFEPWDHLNQLSNWYVKTKRVKP